MSKHNNRVQSLKRDGLIVTAKTIEELEDEVAELKQQLSALSAPHVVEGELLPCPCLHTTPCHENCTCVKGWMSHGCLRCCTYGSPEQQKANAERIAQALNTRPTATQGELVGALRKIADMPTEDNEWDAVDKYDEVRKIAKAALSASPIAGWIAVSERLPKHEQKVYYCFNGNVFEGEFENAEYCSFHGRSGFLHFQDVSHWMPRDIPKPPQPSAAVGGEGKE